jgi:hypothetical protein
VADGVAVGEGISDVVDGPWSALAAFIETRR